MTAKQFAITAMLLAAGITYLFWLDSGCGDSLGGVMTWGGKVCVHDLPSSPEVHE